MKKIALLLFFFLISGCSKAAPSDHEKKHFLFATPLREHTIWLKAKEGFDDACEDNDLNCEWLGPVTIDVNKMNEVIETGILQKVDAIITQGVVSEAIIKKAYEANIPILFVDSDLPNTKRVAYMGKDFKHQAELLLEDIQHKYGKSTKLKIAIQVAESGFQIATDQINEIVDVFKKHPGSYEIVNVSESKSDSVRSKKEWNKVLNEQKEINVAINFAAESAEFCSESAYELGIRDQLLIYGVDDMPTTLHSISKGSIDGTIVTSFYDYGYKGTEILLDYLKRDSTKEAYSPNLWLITKDNTGDYKEHEK